MTKAEDYRRYAAECLRVAQGFRSRPESGLLLEMAERWRRLAEQAESSAATHQKTKRKGTA
jgi:hypothetical protein